MRIHHEEQSLVESLFRIQPSSVIYRCLVDRCTKEKYLDAGRSVHAQIIKTHFETDVSIATSLVHMYLKCGILDDASESFTFLGLRNVVLWNAVIGAHCQNGFSEKAIHFFWRTEGRGVVPNDVTYLMTLKACATLKSFIQGCQVYAHMIVSGMELIEFTSNTLIDMYAKCGSLVDALQIFKAMHRRTVTSWNIMISGFAQHGLFDEVLHYFRKMILEGFQPDDYTFVIILRICIDTEALVLGKGVHDYIIRSGSQTGVYAANALIAVYAKCGSLQDAYVMFKLTSEPDLITWNTMIGGFCENKQSTKALELFHSMRRQGMKSDRATFISIFKACISLDDLDMGKKIHACFNEDEGSQCILLMSTLVDMYAKCGSTEDARRIFDKIRNRNVVLWNIMIAGHSDSSKEALKLLTQMRKDSLEPDEVTYLNVLKACAREEDLKVCQIIHNCCVEHGHESNLYIGSSLVDVYGICGRLIEAWRVFEVMPERNIVSWNAIVGGCAQQGHEDVALELFGQMQVEGHYAEEIPYVSVFNACADLADLKQGKFIHARFLFNSKQQNLFIGNALVDMYSKCGAMRDALRVFNNMLEKDAVSWNALISGYAQHGHGKQALEFAEKMEGEGIQFNEITFVGILTACSYVGFIEEAQIHFDSMYQQHGIIPTPEHCACMVDVYGRAGLLNEAVKFIQQMPIEPTSVVWMALLAASKTYGSTELASYAVNQILLTEPENSAAFLLLKLTKV
ncbi:hypothetical protein GOP47_0001124 [Adiantum capillus-veneris]|uniref:Pentatricopeptide repeat-containing protein n=1 Tax=Adiantum capillus-veneris TaxID=13818 RepID=A0A9D4ZTQ3_ADICA|nr:hypothetical protein GOP47_0001124 [Adiantum capillus-veneris]